MDFPPPDLSMPPPGPPPGGHQFQNPGGFHQPRFHSNFHHNKPFFKSYNKHGMQQQDDFDGKRLRKSVMRKTVDYNASIVKALEVRWNILNWFNSITTQKSFIQFQSRIWQRDHRDRRALMPENSYIPDMLPPSSYLDNPSNAITSKFVKTATNKMRCPIFCLAWTPEGRRLITGASSGEFTLWNGLTFNFETILQVRVTFMLNWRIFFNFHIPSGPHSIRPRDGLVAQRQLDGDGRSQRLHQVLAEQHESSGAVSSSQGTDKRNKVDYHIWHFAHNSTSPCFWSHSH